MPKKSESRDRSPKLSPVANGLIALATKWRVEADDAEHQNERRSFADGVRECADELEEFARS